MVESWERGLGELVGTGELRRSAPAIRVRNPARGMTAAKLVGDLNGSFSRIRRRIRETMVYPLVLAFQASREADTIRADVARWRESVAIPGYEIEEAPFGVPALRRFLGSVPEFRNVFYYRLGIGGGWPATVALIGRRIWRPLPSLEINCASVGPGLIVAHGYGAILTAERVGANCTIHQQVSVGWRSHQHHGRVLAGSSRPPILGDEVFLGTGAKVLGAISLGNNVTVGANAVVLHDVPDGCTAIGVPARVIPGRPNGPSDGFVRPLRGRQARAPQAETSP
jgi:serine O-acetyltransferase